MLPTDHPAIVKSYAAFTNQSLMLAEVTKAAELLRCGTPLVELRRLVLDDNLFQLRTEHSRKTFFRAARDRLAGVHEPLLDLLAKGDYDVRRLTCLYLLLLRHRLLREFIAEVLWRELSRLQHRLEPLEIELFFADKRQQVPEIGRWSEATVRKSHTNILRVGVESGLLAGGDGAGHNIQPQLVPEALRSELKSACRTAFLKLLLDQQELP